MQAAAPLQVLETDGDSQVQHLPISVSRVGPPVKPGTPVLVIVGPPLIRHMREGDVC